jgi:hypothetical protein
VTTRMGLLNYVSAPFHFMVFGQLEDMRMLVGSEINLVEILN